MSSDEILEVGAIWKRVEGKERVRLGRVWESDGEILVRLHPRHGGPWWFTTAAEFLKRFTKEPTP